MEILLSIVKSDVRVVRDKLITRPRVKHKKIMLFTRISQLIIDRADRRLGRDLGGGGGGGEAVSGDGEGRDVNHPPRRNVTIVR